MIYDLKDGNKRKFLYSVAVSCYFCSNLNNRYTWTKYSNIFNLLSLFILNICSLNFRMISSSLLLGWYLRIFKTFHIFLYNWNWNSMCCNFDSKCTKQRQFAPTTTSPVSLILLQPGQTKQIIFGGYRMQTKKISKKKMEKNNKVKKQESRDTVKTNKVQLQHTIKKCLKMLNQKI